MTYTEKEKKLVTDLVQEFSRVHNKEKRLKLVDWYSLATGIILDQFDETIFSLHSSIILFNKKQKRRIS
jgi:hypothetical protein